MNLSPAVFIPLPDTIFPNKLALNVPNNVLGNPPFYSLTSFWIASLTPFNNKPEYLRDLSIFIISSISSFDIISAVVPDPKTFYVFPHLLLMLLQLILMGLFLKMDLKVIQGTRLIVLF